MLSKKTFEVLKLKTTKQNNYEIKRKRKLINILKFFLLKQSFFSIYSFFSK